MQPQVFGWQVFDDWLDGGNPLGAKAVLDKIADAVENYEELFREQAPIGARPLARELDVPEAGVTVVVYLQHPNRGINLLSINAW